jgi:phenylacetate-CoA ligase
MFFNLNLFDISLRLNGFPIQKAKHLLKDIQAKNHVEFEAYLESKKHDIVAFHLKQNPFYKNFAKGANPEQWDNIPVMTKRDLQQPLELLLSNYYTKNKVYINKTSGSSGDPFIFAKDKFCHALTWAIIQNRFRWFHLDFNTSKQARFYGIPLDKKGFYKEKLKDFISNRTRFNVFDLSDVALKRNLKKFETTSFDYINGYTSSIVQFAKFLNKENVVLKQVCPTLKACMVTSEMLFENDKKLMETQFGVPIINEYGASELDLIAFENPDGEWQVNSETLFVEILDDKNNVLPYGKEGRIAITSLYNKAQPIIRYEIGDLGTLSKKSTIKKPILEKLIGRTDDIVILPSGKKAAGLTFYYITKSIIEDDGHIKEFVIEQLELDSFRIIYVSTKELSTEKIKKISIEIEKYLEKGLTIVFERQDNLIRSKSGKLKQFTSYLNKNT